MKKLLLILLFAMCFSQTEEWIYYNKYPSVYRSKPDNSEIELFKDSLTLWDISEDGTKFLFQEDANINKLIYFRDNNTIDTLVLENYIRYARLTQIENEIIYYQPSWDGDNSDQIYKYSFLDDSKTLIADSLNAAINYHGTISPYKDKLAYFKSDNANIDQYQLFVVDIESLQKTLLQTIQIEVGLYMPPNIYWAIDDYIYLTISNSTDYRNLYKVHSSNTDIPLMQLTEGNTNFWLLNSQNTDLNKLALTSWSDTNEFISNLWIYDLETSQLSFIDTIQGGYPHVQTWSPDNLKVAIGSSITFMAPFSPIQIYDFVNDTIFSLSDSAIPLFWLGSQELEISNNFNHIPTDYFLKQNFPNPFNPTTNIKYNLPKYGFVNITVFDMLGNVINQLVNEVQNSGYKSIQWNATNTQGQPVSAGVYLYSIEAGDFRQSKKMILLK